MKKLLVLLTALPLLFACSLQDKIDSMTKLSPTIKGYSYTPDGTPTLKDSDAEKALTAFIIGKTKWEGKAGQSYECQVQLNTDKYGGKADKLGIYYFITGTLSYTTNDICSINIPGNYRALNGSWIIHREEDGNKIRLTGGKLGGSELKLKFWHETE